jgi:hypothetical protein
LIIFADNFQSLLQTSKIADKYATHRGGPTNMLRYAQQPLCKNRDMSLLTKDLHISAAFGTDFATLYTVKGLFGQR